MALLRLLLASAVAFASAFTCPPTVNASCTASTMCAFVDADTPTYCVYSQRAPSSAPGKCTVATSALRSDALFGSSCSYYPSQYSHAYCQGYDPWYSAVPGYYYSLRCFSNNKCGFPQAHGDPCDPAVGCIFGTNLVCNATLGLW